MKPNKSAIVITDSAELGDKRLDPVESLAKLKEENARLSALTRKPDQDILGNVDMAQGQPMEWRHLIYLLEKAVPGLIIRDGGYPNSIQLRYPDSDPMYSRANEGDGTRYAGGFKKEVLPEHTWEEDDERGRPSVSHRGWREIINMLIKQQVLSYPDAVDIFGEPYGLRGGRWKNILRQYHS